MVRKDDQIGFAYGLSRFDPNPTVAQSGFLRGLSSAMLSLLEGGPPTFGEVFECRERGGAKPHWGPPAATEKSAVSLPVTIDVQLSAIVCVASEVMKSAMNLRSASPPVHR